MVNNKKNNNKKRHVLETRQELRIPISTTSKLIIDPSVKQRFDIAKKDIEVKNLDISLGGVGLLSKYFIPKGVILNLEFTLSDNLIKTKVEVKSAVAAGKGFTRLGTGFIDLTKQQKKLIKDFIKETERRIHPRLEV